MDALKRDHLRQLADELRYHSSERLRTLAEGCLELLDATEQGSLPAPAVAAPPPAVAAPPPAETATASTPPDTELQPGQKWVRVTCWCREMHLWQKV